MSNVGRARKILQSLARQGVAEVVVCAGARNAPLVALLDKVRGIKVHGFFEERSAGFFALGRSRASGRPVVVCTTSGTAVAELLPAVIEADYQGVPLVVLSADRPQSFRGTGAPQTIVQPGIFSAYVERCWDLVDSALEFSLSPGRPVHLNVSFAEPLLDEAVGDWELWPGTPASRKLEPGPVCIPARKPLVIASGLSISQAEEVRPLLKQWQRPLYLEATSQLRGHPDLCELELQGDDRVDRLDFDGVIRIGSVPTLRYWRDLESSAIPVWNFSDEPWCGLPRERLVHPLSSLRMLKGQFEAWGDSERLADRKCAQARSLLLREFPLSEPAWLERLSAWIPSEALVFLGNSLPIREWDFCAQGGRGHFVQGNRGVNGIDGLISTFLGMASSAQSNWAIVGDLSALYDLAAPWCSRAHPVADVNLVIINNGGGKIFERMFRTALFENRHEMEFSGFAKMWGWDYVRVAQDFAGVAATTTRPRVIEIVPDALHTKSFWEQWESLR